MPDSKTANPYLILFALWLMMFSASSQLIIMVPILPEIAETLGVNAFWRGMLLTAYALSLGVSALITGPASDRIGRRRILLYGAGLMTVTLAKPRQVVCIADPDKVPEQYTKLIPSSRQPVKADIQKALKAGNEVPGCTLEDGAPSLRIS